MTDSSVSSLGSNQGSYVVVTEHLLPDLATLGISFRDILRHEFIPLVRNIFYCIVFKTAKRLRFGTIIAHSLYAIPL